MNNRPFGPILALFLCLGTNLVAQEQSLEARMAAMEERHQVAIRQLRQQYETRIAKLEERAEEGSQTSDALSDQIAALNASPLGLPSRPYADINSDYTNAYNPAIALISDFAAVASNRDDSYENANRFDLRSLELAISGQVDPHVSYFAVVHIDEEELELEEAYAVLEEGLIDTLEFKAGRYNLAFGKTAAQHDHALHFVDKALVVQSYLGGTLRGTGVGLKHWVPLGDTTLLSWSFNVVNDLDSDSHAIFGPEAGGHEHSHGDEETFGERSFDNLAYSARMEFAIETGQSSQLQIGASLAYAPNAIVFHNEEEEHEDFFFDGAEPEEEHGERFELKNLVVGLDLTWTWNDYASGESLLISGEFFYSDREFELEEEDGVDGPANYEESSWGFFARSHWQLNQFWGLGISGGWYQAPEDSNQETWDLGLAGTWNVNELNRLRLEGRYFDTPDDEFWGLTLQWTLILGHHKHGLDW